MDAVVCAEMFCVLASRKVANGANLLRLSTRLHSLLRFLSGVCNQISGSLAAFHIRHCSFLLKLLLLQIGIGYYYYHHDYDFILNDS